MSRTSRQAEVEPRPFTRLFRLAILAMLVGVGASRQATAQVLYGSLVGTVKDPSGAAVPGATVTAVQEQTSLTRSVTTSSTGDYTLSTLSAGTYDVKVSAKGFKAFTRTGVPVTINAVSRVDATLEVGAVNQTVEVTSAAPLLQTDRADVHHNITSTELENLPMPPGNDFESLFVAVPGINPPQNAHSISTNPTRSLQFVSNGTSSYGNDVRIDGVSQINIWVPENAAYIPSSDALEIVNISTNSYAPDQGLAGGSSVNAQIKSGTNQFHGDVYETHYDNALEGLGYFDPNNGITRVPKDIYNQFGGSVGGPIKKDKLFFFANTEFTRQRTYATRLGTVPTAAERKGDLRGLDFVNGTVKFLGGIGASAKANQDFVYDPTTGKTDGSGKGRTVVYATNNQADAATYNALCNAGDPGSTVLSSGTDKGFTQCMNVVPTSRLSTATQKLLSLLPMANLPNQAGDVPSNNYLAATDFSFNRWSTDDKIDWNATDKFTMYGHIGYLTYNDLNPQMFDVNGGAVGGEYIDGFGGNEGRGDGHTLTFAITANYVASPNFVLDASFGMTRQVTNSQQLDLAKDEGLNVGIPGSNGTAAGQNPRNFTGSWPAFSISGFSQMGTYDNFMPYFRNDPQFNYTGNSSWIRGPHTLRFGVDIRTLHLNQQQPEWNGGGTSFGPQGGFNFRADTTQCSNCSASGKTSSSNAYNDMGSFLMGLDTNFGENIQVPDFFHTNTKEYGFYGGDQWQVNSKLTVNYGLRWEYYPMPTRTNGLGVEHYNFQTGTMEQCGTKPVPIDCGTSVSWKGFAPRIGLAYRAPRGLVVRTGYGLTTEPFNLVDDLRTNYPILIPFDQNQPKSEYAAGVLDMSSLVNTPNAECTVFAAYCINGALPVGIASSNLTVPNLTSQAEYPIPGNINLVTTGNSVHRGYIQSWNFTLEKQVGAGWVAQAGYVATRSVNQLGQLDLNAGSPVGPAGCIVGSTCGGSASQPYNNLANTVSATGKVTSTGLCPSTSSTLQGCRTGTVTLITPTTNTHYDSLQATLTHQFAHGYLVKFGYTWSKTWGMAYSQGGGNYDEKHGALIATPQFRGLNRGIASIDVPQHFNATFIWQPPLGAGRAFATSGIASKILGGWQLSGLITEVSGYPIELQADGSSLNAPGNTQRPDRVSSQVPILHQVGPGTYWFDPRAFQGVTGNPSGNDQRFGTSPFYFLHGPYKFNMDGALFRTFKLTERINLQFRAQALNLTNTPHFDLPSNNCGSYSATLNNHFGCSSSSFGRITGITNFAREGIDQRQFEFNARVSF